MSLHAKRLAEEGNAVTAILLFWYVLAVVAAGIATLGRIDAFGATSTAGND